MLTGTVTPVLDGAISVLVIRENGDVQNFSGSVSPTRRPAHFGLALQGSATRAAETFLLMVLASGAPLPTLADGGPRTPAIRRHAVLGASWDRRAHELMELAECAE